MIIFVQIVLCNRIRLFCINCFHLLFFFLCTEFLISDYICIIIYHTSDKIVGILLDRSRSHDSVKITVLGVEFRIGRLIEFEVGGEQSKMADDELVAMDLS